jgi:hypothetical protein
VSHYDVLGVAPDADASTIRRAYVELARQHHPDRTGGDAARMRAVNDAWATLSDPARRAGYDLSLVRPAVGAPPVAPPSPPSADDEDWWADLDDDTPIRITVAAPRWLGLVPVALFALSIAAVVVGAVFAAPPLLGLALLLFVLSCLLFLAAPFVALFASRRGPR